MSVQNIITWLSMILFTACSGDKEITLYNADCNGQSLEFSVKERKHFAYTEYWMEIKIGALKTIIITPQNVSGQTPIVPPENRTVSLVGKNLLNLQYVTEKKIQFAV